jgi:hypothetical protein
MAGHAALDRRIVVRIHAGQFAAKRQIAVSLEVASRVRARLILV